MRKDLSHHFHHNTMQAMYKGDIEKRRAAIVADTRDFLDHHEPDAKKFTEFVRNLRDAYRYDSDTNGEEIFPESIRNAAHVAKTSWEKEHDSAVPPRRQQCCKCARTSANKFQDGPPFGAAAPPSKRQACDSAMRAGAMRINALPIPKISAGTCWQKGPSGEPSRTSHDGGCSVSGQSGAQTDSAPDYSVTNFDLPFCRTFMEDNGMIFEG